MADGIVVNGRFEGRRITGVERYGTEVLRCLGTRVKVIKPRRPMTGMRGHLWEQLTLPLLLGADESLWSPANTGPLAVRHQVVTIHDLSVLDHPEWFAASFRLWYLVLLPRLAARARRVLTVSEHSRRTLIKRFNLPEDRVAAIPNGVNRNQFHPCNPAPVRAKYQLGDRYILFVGSLEPRKNLERLLQAWMRLEDLRGVELVIAGSKADIFGRVVMPGSMNRVRLLGYVPEDDLPGLYAGATCFIMPSLFEGFGLSVLEAMACGAPVISSHGGALGEVVSDAAIAIDPTSVEGMAEAMRTLLLDESAGDQLRQKGMERVKLFSWERSAEEIWKVLSAHE